MSNQTLKQRNEYLENHAKTSQKLLYQANDLLKLFMPTEKKKKVNRRK